MSWPGQRPDFVPTFTADDGRTYRIERIGTCLGCGGAIFNVPDSSMCDCWDEPPPEFGIPPPPTLEALP